jgi:hypothetical protein
MKTNVNSKPQGHSAKRWHGTLQKDLMVTRQALHLKKRRSSQALMWKQLGS